MCEMQTRAFALLAVTGISTAETMSTTPLLSLPHSPSPSTPQSHDPPPPSPTPAPTPSAPSLPSASTSGPIDLIPPVLPSPSRLHRRRPPVIPLTPDEEAAAARVSARYVAAFSATAQQS